MALTKIESSSSSESGAGASSTPPKTIALQHYGSAATLIYTVPEGRVFTGHFWNAAGGSVDAGYIVTGGGSVTNSTNGTYSTQSTWPPYSGQYPNYTTVLTVRAGDKLYSSTNANIRIRIMGVESDA